MVAARIRPIARDTILTREFSTLDNFRTIIEVKFRGKYWITAYVVCLQT